MTENLFIPANVSAVVCTKDSIASLRQCLDSLRANGVLEIVVVDASSKDGSREVADEIADQVLVDEGSGLGTARNIGTRETQGPLLLNMGSDNIMPKGELQKMLDWMRRSGAHGVSARTRVSHTTYPGRGLDAWRTGRFRPGPAAVIGTPTLMRADLMRQQPFSCDRRYSDDSELCNRWKAAFESRFEISDAYVLEVGKETWRDVVLRCKMYGESDEEVFRFGSRSGWSSQRKIASLSHPLKADALIPLLHLNPVHALSSSPFLFIFAGMRYFFWARAWFVHGRHD